MKVRFLISFFSALVFLSCLYGVPEENKKDELADLPVFVAPESIPEEIIENIIAHIEIFFKELQIVLEQDKNYNLLILVDKKNLLSADYRPQDIIPLAKKKSYKINRPDLSLRFVSEAALEEMAFNAKNEGISLLVSSSYRSYSYQEGLFNRYTKQYGEAEANRFSARAGASQHQLGTVVDFGSITPEFAQTKEGRWVFENAGTYGWSLSYPKEYESITGYVWEPWHYRYLGVEACALQKKWFHNIQQYMLVFIDAWEKSGLSF